MLLCNSKPKVFMHSDSRLQMKTNCPEQQNISIVRLISQQAKLKTALNELQI